MDRRVTVRGVLFDLVADPEETRDLNEPQHSDEDTRRRLAMLRVLLDDAVRRVEAQGSGDEEGGEAGRVDEATREQLRALGYVE